MLNEHVARRLTGVLNSLVSTYQSTSGFASASTGAARSEFIQKFLKQSIPPAFRIEISGQITDMYGKISGEIDIVLENTFTPTLPVIGTEAGRLHFAEGVGAAIEIKSNLAGQWNDALSTGARVKHLRRNYSGGLFGNRSSGTLTFMLPGIVVDESARQVPNDPIQEAVPFFIVGYEGWSNPETVAKKLEEAEGRVDGILQLNPPIFVSAAHLNGIRSRGWPSMLAFIACLQQSFSYVKNGDADLLNYAR